MVLVRMPLFYEEFSFTTLICNIAHEPQELQGPVGSSASKSVVIKYHKLLPKGLDIKGKGKLWFDQLAIVYSSPSP